MGGTAHFYNASYNIAGQLTSDTLALTVNETYGYDANRMQLTTQTATKTGGPQNGLMNLTYNYQASAGQMGAGSTAGNAGQLMSISGTINQTTENAAYSYDNLGRLGTSNQTSNGSSAQRRFALDRWGNRTGVWDAVSGGNQIQLVTLQQSGGAPTNRITSVTSGSTVNYTYDSAGNVTNDGAHSYVYDAENRIVSIDSGAYTYAYDHQNRRVKKVGGGANTHYVWEGSQVIAEYNGSTGAQLVWYYYAGSRMITKIEGGAARHFLRDRLSTRVVLDGSGNVVGRQAHLPFGEDWAETGTQEKHHFTSYERDSEIGADYAVNRQYSQMMGRFSRVDPVTTSSCSPQNHNRYSYAQSDPVNSIDPLGLQSLTFCFWSLGGFVSPLGDGTFALVAGVVPEGCIRIDGGFGLIPGPGSGQEETEQQRKCRERMAKLSLDYQLDIKLAITQFTNGILGIVQRANETAFGDLYLNLVTATADLLRLFNRTEGIPAQQKLTRYRLTFLYWGKFAADALTKPEDLQMVKDLAKAGNEAVSGFYARAKSLADDCRGAFAGDSIRDREARYAIDDLLKTATQHYVLEGGFFSGVTGFPD